MMEFNFSEIRSKFCIESDAEPYGNGHINDTYVLDGKPKYILQKINTAIFKNPDELMENVLGVTEHLKKKIKEAGGDPERETLTVVRTRDNEAFYRMADGTCFRVYKFIDNATSYDLVEEPMQLYHAAKAFGRFQKHLSDYPAESLHETIVKFHDTKDRFRQLKEAIENNKAGRLESVKEEVEFALAREKDAGIVLDAIKEGKVPVRVTHNDTKLNNVMLDNDTGEGVCVIDLDTVMPGSLLYDFGDALRFAGSSGAEDETDLSKIWFNLENYECFAKGFIEELNDELTDKEKELLPFSVKLMTYECGIRFLADYLNGDVYFKIHRPDHNLDRCRTQFKLVKDLEEKLDKMSEINKKYFK